MSPASADQPMRASDQDRHEAVLALTDHVAEGRLDHEEFERRMSSAQQATYLHELDPLFLDLPGSRSAVLARPAAATAGMRGPAFGGRRPVVLPLLVAALVTVAVVMGGHVLWLLVPVWWIALGATGRRLRHAHGTRPGVAGSARARSAIAGPHHP